MSRAEEVASLQAALAGEHAAIYGYGIVGANVGPSQRRLAAAADATHRTRREQARVLLLQRDAKPVAAAAAYRLPVQVTTSAQAKSLAVDIEQRVAALWIDVVGQAGGTLRAFAAGAVQDAGVRAALWRGNSEPLPGLQRAEHP